jgi:membrane protein
MMVRLWRLARALGARVGRDNVGVFAAALSYNFAFALLPLLLFATALLGFLHFAHPVQVLTAPWVQVVPDSVLDMVSKALKGAVQHRSPTVLSLGFLGFVWGMSGAFRQVVNGVNSAYEYRYPFRRKAWQVYGLSVLLGVTVGTLMVVGLALSVLGPNAVLGLTTAVVGYTPARVAVDLLHWGLLGSVLWIALSILYAVAPDRPRRFSLYTPGTLVTEGAWALLSIGFRQYTERVNTFGVYGTLGSLILLLLYLYLFGFLLLVGAEVNAVLDSPPQGEAPIRPQG